MKIVEKYSQAGPKNIEKLEKLLGKQLPKDYVGFLLQNNGGKPDVDTFTDKNGKNYGVRIFYGFYDIDGYYNILKNYKFYSSQKRIMGNMLPIAEDSSGNLFLISLGQHEYGTIYFWDHEQEADEDEEATYQNLVKLENSFNKFVKNLKIIELSKEHKALLKGAIVKIKPGAREEFKKYLK